jgi:hypothetical protein
VCKYFINVHSLEAMRGSQRIVFFPNRFYF